MNEEKNVVGLGFYPKKPKVLSQWLANRNSQLAVLNNEYKESSNLLEDSKKKIKSLKEEEARSKYDPNSRPIEEIKADIAKEEERKKEIEIDNKNKEQQFLFVRDNNDKYNKFKETGMFEGGTVGFEFQSEDDHIIENVKRIISTRRGERVGNLAFGSDVSKLLFMPEMSIDDVIQEIANSIKRNDNRIEVVECTLKAIEWDTVEIDLKIRVRRTNKILEVKTNISQGE